MVSLVCGLAGRGIRERDDTRRDAREATSCESGLLLLLVVDVEAVMAIPIWSTRV